LWRLAIGGRLAHQQGPIMTPFRTFLLTVPALCLSACAEPEAEIFADPSPDDAPALYRVSDDDSVTYLFGTFHLLPPGTEWQTNLFDNAMAETPITMIEADVVSPEAQTEIQRLVQQYGMNPAGTTLSQTLGEERTEKLVALLEPYGIPLQALEPLRPWLALLSITQVIYGQAGLNPNEGVEARVLAKAVEEGDRVEYLETAATQIEALAGLDESDLLESFSQSLDDLSNLETQVKDGVDAWRRGAVEELDAVLIADTRDEAPAAYDAIFTIRNKDWANTIERLMTDDQDRFIAVGAGHLYGEANVITLLAEKGFSVERIQ
jgi:uncharacterized protein YbaP (TraB family)